MEITGRLTSDAEIKTTKSKREMVTFTIAVNDSYKAKDGEWKEHTEFFACAYWLSTKIADRLQKSSIVTVTGRLYLNEYKGKDGNNYACLAIHVNIIKIIAGASKSTKRQSAESAAPATTPEAVDDLPF